MVGIVIVSHSARLAEGIRELVEQMIQGPLPLAVAGGIDDPDHPIGTDAIKVQAAIESVYSEDGVVVLMDLGSALLSAETAVDFLPPDQQANVYLCEAPLVEGAIAAAVQASVGGTVAQVLQEARGALAVKAQQLSAQEMALPPTPAVSLAPAPADLKLIVGNRLGLHARPAAQLVRTANQFEADITVCKGEQTANAKSINQVATLGVRQGDEITVTAVGPDADAALAAIQALADANFGDADTEPVSSPTVVAPVTTAAGEWMGIAAAPGVAVGPALVYRPRLPEVTTRTVTDVAAEWERLQAAIAAAEREIESLREQALRRAGPAEAAIFEAHQLFLQDPALVGAARTHLFNQQINAEAAWQQVIEATADQYRALADEYQRARAADVLDVGRRVLSHLMNVEPPTLDITQPVILVAADLTPSDTARLDPANVLGIATELGGATAHSAILARALGIPAVVGLGAPAHLDNIAEGQVVGLNGTTGQFWPAPDADQQAELAAQRQAWLAAQQQARQASVQPAITQDGRRLEIAANIGNPQDAAKALTFGAEGVGLFRTEFLFMERDSAPTEAEQLAAYRAAAKALGQRPLIIRTLDVGGDKPLPYLDITAEANPFLGWRGIRFCLDRPHIFKPQLRAILRASDGHNVKLMFPMVGTVNEVRAAKAVLAEAQAELRQAGIPFDEMLEVGIMVEVPAAVAVADQLAAEVDFFSIGTNDLTQYVMAADRGNARVAGLANALQPAVLRLIRQTAEAAHAADIWVGMCGELAGEVLATPVLVGLGLDELSMNAPAIPAVKAAVRSLTLARAQQIAQDVLALETAEEVQAYLASVGNGEPAP